MTVPKVPRRPRRPLTLEPNDVVTMRERLWRIRRTRGDHVLPWNALRTFGPLAGQRWDPHPEPCQDHPDCGVCYAALDVATCAAEVFQVSRRVVASNGVHLTAWAPTRALTLLDLTGNWALRNGAAHALHAANRPTCRAWSHAIWTTWPDLDGLQVPSTLTGRLNVVLFPPAIETFPTAPEFSRPLDEPVVLDMLETLAARIGYEIRT